MEVKEKPNIGYLHERLKKSNETQKRLADRIGISEGYLSKFFCGKEIAFWMIRKIVQAIDPDNETAIMKNYCLSGVKKKNFAPALEYCYAKKLFDVIHFLINDNNKDDMWAVIYRLILNYRLDVGSVEFRKELNGLQADRSETKILLDILKMYLNYDMGKYELALFQIEIIQEAIQEINDPFLTISFSARLEEVLINIYLKQENNIEKARRSAENLLEDDLSLNLNLQAYYTLGLSYILESYQTSLYYYLKCINILEKHPDRVKELIQNKEEIAILQSLWNEKVEERYQVTLLAKTLASGESLIKFYKHNYYSKYAYLLDGIKENSKEKLLISLCMFTEKKDIFRSNIPKIHLKKLGIMFNLD
ncbi:AimR family lysis-lysogeny pheromone receptor [Bacillus safensis]|uniref:AimR family lysis-lysogeny pheromone receptor n=1 Tax=Bacillus safensis TaxID=561879 RepID=UPI000B438B32|nr:AimR family lysis-lysogeny pheromone receptor [Bacillus safensis]MCY7492910.1 AimR family lysis-lysogeny pheromone receptor [Bacillus safensis]MED4993209.1 AimR family lysis-lysogeny pheromone receptor [Bacillus safensis]UDB49141.1 AimR family lysis-lysogeny pheromone receptor [Bacillus safensis]